MSLSFYSEAKGLKLKVRKFIGLMSMFRKVTSEKLVGGPSARLRLLICLILLLFAFEKLSEQDLCLL